MKEDYTLDEICLLSTLNDFLKDNGSQDGDWLAAEEVLCENPSLVDLYVEKWHSASHYEKRWLYGLILCGVPIKECIDWGIANDDFEDDDLSEYNYFYLDSDGAYTPITLSEYPAWLEEQKIKEGRCKNQGGRNCLD